MWAAISARTRRSSAGSTGSRTSKDQR
jgi:hypothetical protein